MDAKQHRKFEPCRVNVNGSGAGGGTHNECCGVRCVLHLRQYFNKCVGEQVISD